MLGRSPSPRWASGLLGTCLRCLQACPSAIWLQLARPVAPASCHWGHGGIVALLTAFVCWLQTFRDGSGTTGIVDFPSRDDMKYAIRKLDDSEFKNPL